MDSMIQQPDNDHPKQLQAFDNWLGERTVVLKPGMQDRIRSRMAREEQSIEHKLDRLFQMDPALSSPEMAGKVRLRLEKNTSRDKVIWFQWATPIAAALLLGVAFFSFQNRAAIERMPVPQEAAIVISSPAESPDDLELTRIFALASNLQGTSDMSRLQSVDDLAFLFE